MKIILHLFIFFAFVGCKDGNQETSFFDDCGASSINLENGITITDSLGYFSYQIPDSSWHPIKQLDENGNGLTVGDISNEYYQVFNINQNDYTGKWIWEEELKKVEEDFNVIEKGNILFRDQKKPYHLIKFDENEIQSITFYVTILDTTKKRNYTIALSTEMTENYKRRICDMKPLMESFEIH